MIKKILCVRTREISHLHGLDCKWVFRLGECVCFKTKATREPTKLAKGSVVLAYESPFLVGWGSLGWWIITDGKLLVISNFVEDSFNDVFEEP